MQTRFLMVALALLLHPATALAHVGHGATTGLGAGLAHPLVGLDHLLAMVAVGLWATQQGGRALWVMPLTFVLVMLAAGALGLAGVAVPYVEGGIIASLLVLGLLLALATRMPLAAASVIVACAAFFHGHAHGAEMPLAAGALAYSIGFAVSTSALLAVGVGMGQTVQRINQAVLVRAAGVMVAAVGVWLVAA